MVSDTVRGTDKNQTIVSMDTFHSLSLFLSISVGQPNTQHFPKYANMR